MPVLAVAVHDVTPRTLSDVRIARRALRLAGARRASLLAVPNHDRRAPLDEDAHTCRWLLERAEAGDEIQLHGLVHSRAGQSPLRALPRLLDAALARGAGEFLSIDAVDASSRLAEGAARLRAAGLTPAGFTAPAWLYGPGARAALRASGLPYFTTQTAIEDIRSGTRRLVPALSQRPGSRGEAAARRAVAACGFALIATRRSFRIAVHPADTHNNDLLGAWCSLVRQAADAGYDVGSYAELRAAA